MCVCVGGSSGVGYVVETERSHEKCVSKKKEEEMQNGGIFLNSLDIY